MSLILNSYGQSGNRVQTRESNPIQPSNPNVISATEKSSISVFEIDQYKLGFPITYEGQINWKFSEFDQMIESERISFIDQINKSGEQGYRFVSGILGRPVAISKSDEVQYEYEMFETTSSVHFAKSGLQEKLKEMSEKEFRVVEHFFLSQSCEWIDPDNPVLEKCIYKDLFLFEKEKGVKKPVEQVLVNSFPGWGSKPSVEMTAGIEEKLAEGFYPVKVLSKFEILIEKARDKNDLLSDKPDVQIVRSGWGTSNVQKKVNELAKQGYRLALTNNGIAVMYRNRETAGIPVSYTWLKTDKKSFDKDLAKLQEKGAVYRTTYPSEKGTLNTLIFEQTLSGKGERGEFKTLKFDFDSVENKAERKVYIDLTPSSKEAVKIMNALAKDGFVVRDLFYSDKVSVILERIK